MNKKGLGVHWFMMLGYIIGLLLFLIMLSALVMNSIAKSADTHDMEYYLVYNRITYSKDSIFYYDPEIDRIYPGVIDLKKLNEDTLKTLFGEQTDFAVKLSIGDQGSRYDLLYNEKLYDPAFYTYKFENSIYGGMINKFPVINKNIKNDIIELGIMYIK